MNISIKILQIRTLLKANEIEKKFTEKIGSTVIIRECSYINAGDPTEGSLVWFHAGLKRDKKHYHLHIVMKSSVIEFSFLDKKYNRIVSDLVINRKDLVSDFLDTIKINN